MGEPVVTAAPAAEPEPEIVVRLVDYDFAFSRPLTRGRHTIRFDDAGRQPHEVIVERLAAGRTLAEAMAADSSAPDGKSHREHGMVKAITVE